MIVCGESHLFCFGAGQLKPPAKKKAKRTSASKRTPVFKDKKEDEASDKMI